MDSYTDKPTEWSFHFTPWETAFLNRVHSAKRLVRIACPFIKLRNTRLILASLSEVKGTPIHLQVLTRLNARDCRARVHDVAAMQLLLDNPVRTQCSIDLRIDNSLHAKLYIFDDEEAIVSSSNLTYAGFYRNLEVALATTRADTVQSVVAHFSELFQRAQRVSQNEITEIRSQLQTLLPLAPESYLDSPSEIVTDRSGEDSLASLPLSSKTLEAIDSQLEVRLEDAVCDGVFTVDSQPTEILDAEKTAERRFLEDMQLRMRMVFGEPFASELELNTIFAHKTAYSSLRTAIPDTNRAELCTETGKHALFATVALLVFRDSKQLLGGEQIVAKTDYICCSHHILRQLFDRGLMRVIVGRGVMGGGQQSKAIRKGLTKIAGEVAFRLVAYLFETRKWDEYIACMDALLKLNEEFPFESYREENYKSMLQAFCQRDYDASPKYECIGREGPDHDTRFTIEVWGGKKHTKLLANGQGRSLKEAECDAAYQALSIFLKSALDGSRPVGSPPWPDWFHENCRHQGRMVIRKMCGRDFSDAVCEAVLVPFNHDDVSIKWLRGALAAVGGKVRELMAYHCVSAHVADHSELHRRITVLNNKSRLVPVVLDTPLGEWLRALAKSNSFAYATQAGPVIETLNCLIGALVMHHGFEACKSIETILFPQTDVVEPGVMHARSKLQQTVQAALKGRATDLVRIESRPLHKREEAHNPRYEVTVFLGDTKLGQGVAGKMKMAIEEACAEALANPCLQDTLDKLIAGQE